MTFPHSNEYMTYDKEAHRYILTPKAVVDKIGKDLNVLLNKGKTVNTQNLASILLDEVSDFVYGEIYTYNINNDFQEYLLAKAPSARGIIFDAMIAQVEYIMVNGQLENYAGIDLRKNTMAGDFSARLLAPRAKMKLSKVLKETGASILFQGNYPIYFEFNYEKDNY